ncbi:DUF1715-domain-containing protein [Hypomontagnella monticulosa]|nr:DUF1715-domain-containing protein [Hypomontagnella monticulosa]
MASDDLFEDPFDDLLNLEEKYYKEGYEEGFKEGAEAGRIEGRSVGMKKGFEKFLEAGQMQSRAIIWANRIPNLKKLLEAKGDDSQDTQQEPSQEPSQESPQESSSSSQDKDKPEKKSLPPIKSNPRLEKNVTMLYGLLEPGTFSTKNDDESVNDFDSRIQSARGKVKMIERVVGEGDKSSAGRRRGPPIGQKNENIEDFGIGRATQGRETEITG